MSYREKINMERIPVHVAIIMDGNGRWAKQRGQIRSFGHQVGARKQHDWGLSSLRYIPFRQKTGIARQRKYLR